MDILIKNIKSLLQVNRGDKPMVSGQDMASLPSIDNSFLLIREGLIEDYGPMADCKYTHGEIINADGKLVLPAFCDPHTHLVYAGSREMEYSDKIRGLSYEEIAQRGGGINNSAALLRETTEESLFEQSMLRIKEVISFGTGAIEIKSGYGLDTESELKMLRVIRRISENSPLTVRATFLGAHAVPLEYKGRQTEYVDKIINEMLPAVAAEGLADFVDVFCDRGFFTVDETDRILSAAAKYGMRPKIHANELDTSGGIQVGVKNSALSVDHLEFTGEKEIEILRNSGTMPTLLPGAAFFLGMDWPPARQMIDSGLPLALATDFNPGSSPNGDMKLIMSLACIKLRMLPAEALNAATINAAYAMDLEKELGSIDKGKKANIIITKKVPSMEYLPYAYGSQLIHTRILNGKITE
jgi:imidazolonepropionase